MEGIILFIIVALLSRGTKHYEELHTEMNCNGFPIETLEIQRHISRTLYAYVVPSAFGASSGYYKLTSSGKDAARNIFSGIPCKSGPLLSAQQFAFVYELAHASDRVHLRTWHTKKVLHHLETMFKEGTHMRLKRIHQLYLEAQLWELENWGTA
jgi:hypothetical protein